MFLGTLDEVCHRRAISPAVLQSFAGLMVICLSAICAGTVPQRGQRDLPVDQQVHEHLSYIATPVSLSHRGPCFPQFSLISIWLSPSRQHSLLELCVSPQSIPEKMKWQDEVTASANEGTCLGGHGLCPVTIK